MVLSYLPWLEKHLQLYTSNGSKVELNFQSIAVGEICFLNKHVGFQKEIKTLNDE